MVSVKKGHAQMQIIMQLYEFKAYEVLRGIKLPHGKQSFFAQDSTQDSWSSRCNWCLQTINTSYYWLMYFLYCFITGIMITRKVWLCRNISRRSFYYGRLSDWLIVKTKVKEITLLGKLNFSTSEIQTFSRKKFLFTKRFFLLVNLLIPSFWLGCLVVADIVLIEIQVEKRLKLSAYLNQIWGVLSPVSALLGLTSRSKAVLPSPELQK